MCDGDLPISSGPYPQRYLANTSSRPAASSRGASEESGLLTPDQLLAEGRRGPSSREEIGYPKGAIVGPSEDLKRRSEVAPAQKVMSYDRDVIVAKYDQVEELKKQGLGSGQIARQLKVSKQTVARWMKSKGNPKDTRGVIAEVHPNA